MVLGVLVAFTGYWMIPFLGLAIFGLSALSILLFLCRDIRKSVGIPKLGRAAVRYGILILASLLTLTPRATLQVPRGGKP
jgi:hypothetical protein